MAHHVVSWSGGKDSTATVLLLHKFKNEIIKPEDKVTILFAEVMFDKMNNISGHHPDVIDFIYKTAKRFQQEFGFDTKILHSDKDYLDIFYHKLTRSPDPNRVGMTHGFVSAGICSVKRDCKLRPIEYWLKQHSNEDIIQYVGIAMDEPKRLISLKKQENKESLLEKYGITEADAREMCLENDMLSPNYFFDSSQKRDGCWFCPHAKLCEHKAIYEYYPEVWKQFVALEDTPNLAYPKWNCYSEETLKERDARVKKTV